MALGVIALGSYVPDTVITNADISAWTGATQQWIAERTGVHERRYAAAHEATSDLAVHAARRALSSDPAARERLRALIVATATPDVPQPATAAIVQHKLGLSEVPAFDINAVCSGFLYAVTIAGALAATPLGAGGQLLVVGADRFSTIMDRSDRKTVSLFGDGAGALLLGEVPEGYGFGPVQLITNGELHDLVKVHGGGTAAPLTAASIAEGAALFRMEGRAVRDYALEQLEKLTARVLGDAGISVGELDRLVFHQANPQLLRAFADSVGAPRDKLELTAPEYGNTAAASVAVTLDAAHRRRPFRRGDRILLGSVGGGMNAAVTLLTWY
ncbi:3-oxoacyl-ACP synthase III family protein [Actinoplanes sp. TFC3]|uniref:3-oxoacyl-ACP synthase III family protein n=1 Tax=Actinoplanes sp. TFC3 TaxID=1710355 RepID=UPI00082C0F8C|nr:ketoacyl-ACP synthase III [Actinoplanes sp. TFC3]